MTVESLADSVRLLFDWLAPVDASAPDDDEAADDVVETEGEEL